MADVEFSVWIGLQTGAADVNAERCAPGKWSTL